MSNLHAPDGHHPGPPRFLAVGESVQLAPRDPDPAATYEWRVRERPAESRCSLGSDPIQPFEPDAPGRYVLELAAPDGRHRMTTRVFPGDARPSGDDDTEDYAAIAESTVDAVDVAPAEGASGDDGDGEPAGGGGRPRVRLDATRDGDELVVRADARPHPDDPRDPGSLGAAFLLDDRDGVAHESLSVAGQTARLPLSAVDDRVRIHGVAVGESYSVADCVDVRVDDGSVSVDRPNDPPKWATETTIYEVYVRGFADPPEGETVFDALIDRLEYLVDLGVETLWLTPVLENDDAPHGYNVTDFGSIAADLGERADYERFVDAAHDRGLTVLFDFVANHSARQHPHYQAAISDSGSEYHDWYEWRGPGDPETYFDWEKIANFDFTTPAVRRHLLDAVDEWAPLVDGFRCDMAWAVPRSFWQELRDRLKAHDPEFLLLDETIPYVPDFHELTFDVHFDTTTYFALRQIGNDHRPAGALLDAVDDRRRSGFPDHAAFALYAENHDETRYLVECGDDAARAALGALCTLPGVPMLYAGQEIGQRGRRDAIAWEHAREPIREHARELLALRRRLPELGADGGLNRVDADGPREAVAFRRGGSDGVVVGLHFGGGSARIPVDIAVEETDLLSGDARVDDGALLVDDVAVFRTA